MSKEIVYNDKSLIKWVSDIIGGGDEFPEDSTTIGLKENGEFIAGVVYTQYTGTSITMNVAASKKGWLNRAYLRACFIYPFVQLGCRRVGGLVRVDNLKAQKFDEHLGFVREGLLREADEDGCDLIVYGMLKRECRWLDI